MTRMTCGVAGLLLGLSDFGCKQSQHSEARDHGAHATELVAPLAAPGATANAEPSLARREGAGHEGHELPTPGPPAGYAAFTLPPDRARAVGLRAAPVEERDFSKLVRTTGVVVLDETRTSHVHAKVRGWIETINVDFVGKSVAAGAPLCSIYSQEVLAAELEFLSTLSQASSTPGVSGPLAEAERRSREQLITAGRQRLALWDVPAAEIARLEATRQPQRTFSLVAPRSGIVVAKQALAGMFIDPSVELYVISDVRKLWLIADLYESDVPGVKVGDRAMLTIEGMAGAHVPAEVAFLPPTVEEATRTVKVRFNLDNREGAIRPGAFATAEMHIHLGRTLSVPEAAVIHAGRQAIVFVVDGDRIEPRSVQLGPLVDAYYGVQTGVAAGEQVAVGAQFLIDSESRLRASSGTGPSHGGH